MRRARPARSAADPPGRPPAGWPPPLAQQGRSACPTVDPTVRRLRARRRANAPPPSAHRRAARRPWATPQRTSTRASGRRPSLAGAQLCPPRRARRSPPRSRPPASRATPRSRRLPPMSAACRSAADPVPRRARASGRPAPRRDRLARVRHEPDDVRRWTPRPVVPLTAARRCWRGSRRWTFIDRRVLLDRQRCVHGWCGRCIECCDPGCIERRTLVGVDRRRFFDGWGLVAGVGPTSRRRRDREPKGDSAPAVHVGHRRAPNGRRRTAVPDTARFVARTVAAHRHVVTGDGRPTDRDTVGRTRRHRRRAAVDRSSSPAPAAGQRAGTSDVHRCAADP